MLTVISPAKRLDFESPLPTKKLPTAKHSQPRLLKSARPLATAMAKVSPGAMAKMMSLSPQLSELNAERFAQWRPQHGQANARPALCAFDGDVYQGLDAASFTGRDFTRAQNRLRILSGLYGLLRPLDLIQPYRLEMGTSIAALGVGSPSLPKYWSEQVTDLIIADLAQHTPKSQGARALMNLASPEYAAAIDTQRLSEQADVRIISPRFKDQTADGYKVMGLFAKFARGAMAGWLVRNNVRTLKALQEFGELGYRYDPDTSTPEEPVYMRAKSDRPPLGYFARTK